MWKKIAGLDKERKTHGLTDGHTDRKNGQTDKSIDRKQFLLKKCINILFVIIIELQNSIVFI